MHHDEWKVCDGDKRSVSVQGIAKPIQCGSQERAEFIVRACNSHGDLLTALRNMLANPGTRESRREAIAAIAKAEGQK